MGKFNAVAVEDLDVPDEAWMTQGLVPLEGLTIVSGAPKSGKSQLALGLALAAASGRPFANDERFTGAWAGIAQSVIWLATDGGWERELKSRSMTYPTDGRKNLRAMSRKELAFQPGDFEVCYALWNEYIEWMVAEGCKVIVLDHLYNLAGVRGVNTDSDVAPVMRVMNEIAGAGIVPILLHHSSAHGAGNQAKPMGHTLIHATMRASLGVAKATSKQQKVTVTTNSTADMELVVKPLQGVPPEVLDWREAGVREPAAPRRERQSRDDVNLVRTRAILAGPEGARASQSAAGRHLESQGESVMGKAKNGRPAVIKLLNMGLLAAVPTGALISGPNWTG